MYSFYYLQTHDNFLMEITFVQQVFPLLLQSWERCLTCIKFSRNPEFINFLGKISFSCVPPPGKINSSFVQNTKLHSKFLSFYDGGRRATLQREGYW